MREGAARNVNDINEAGNSFFASGNTPDYVRDRIREGRLFRNNLDLGRGLAGAKQNEIGFKNQAFMGLGEATRPNFVQTGSTSTGSSTGERNGPGILSTLGNSFAGEFGGGLGGGLAA